MIKINGNDIMRDGTKIGWITDNHFFNHTGEKIGYTTIDMVFDATTKKLAHIEGEFVYFPNIDKRVRLEDAIVGIESLMLSNIQRVSIKIFFGN